MTKIIGLTGGIGSGKSTIAAYIAAQGIPVYIADDEARKIMELPEIIHKVQEIFEVNVIENGKLNRKKIADLVFSAPNLLKKLNEIIHPAVNENFGIWLKNNEKHRYIVKEVAILFESGGYKKCDKIILVTAPEVVRIERVMSRDGVTKEQVLDRMKNQWKDEDKAVLSDYIVVNTDLATAKKDVDKILKELNKI
ncbi:MULTISPECIES: dephospho-CoA kinase [unclassified Flavobacterium]|uniref:dephospho-CoA kinase n=1 Tax=unclassified Flavobacterium TaxID=196869 RepID=UPI00086D870C|nr:MULTISPECIES: dephospho-CoA kinase [unclassified Flavobacterium]MBN9282966.1 dephospho-CoA kinase [Flavobacterium sp.]ODS83477.1 MAG: dephospho-CoA kinase [Chryseobacterium sp. SCN 40-13]OJV67600.1 MAG: dephospho-CoA kinase [Flavobacterium sp. 40-81]